MSRRLNLSNLEENMHKNAYVANLRFFLKLRNPSSMRVKLRAKWRYQVGHSAEVMLSPKAIETATNNIGST